MIIAKSLAETQGPVTQGNFIFAIFNLFAIFTFFDLADAFGSVEHNLINHTLKRNGIPDGICKYWDSLFQIKWSSQRTRVGVRTLPFQTRSFSRRSFVPNHLSICLQSDRATSEDSRRNIWVWSGRMSVHHPSICRWFLSYNIWQT